MITRRQFATALAGFTTGVASVSTRKTWAEHPPLRVAISTETLAGATVNDARAAYRVWWTQVGQRLGYRHFEMLNQIFVPSAQLIQMIRAGQVDCFALTAWEYASVMDFVDSKFLVVEDYAADGIDYLLLVQNGSPYRTIEDLKGGKLLLQHHRDTAMLRAWLSIELAKAGRPDVDQFFESPEMHEQISQVILPVFFRTAQAAGITRRAFNMAVELNPQLGRSLRIIATSPKVVADGFLFRKGCDPEDRREFQQTLERLDTIPEGRQVLALYQIIGYATRSCSILNGTVEMIHQYERIRKGSGGKL
ncbi:MAG: phosphate/phosphite/phosphonate ABC transporter substrate-binding protein [Terracidiphilus sp.]